MDVLELDGFSDGAWIFRFDGRVLQIFGGWEVHTATHAALVDSWSIHVKQLTVRVGKTDEGYSVTFCSLASAIGCPDRGILSLTFADQADSRWGRMQSFLSALKTAGANVPTSS